MSVPDKAKKIINVAVGVVQRQDGAVLIARRQQGQHLAGLWEFPGGKIEAGENAATALTRELQEEVGITPQQLEPLITIPYEYPEKTVRLEVYHVTEFNGVAEGNEGQDIKWVPEAALSSVEFPAANAPIIRALLLPQKLAITGAYSDSRDFKNKFARLVADSFTAIQLRAPAAGEQYPEFVAVASKCLLAAGRQSEVQLFLNTEPGKFNILKSAYPQLNLHLHLTSSRLAEFSGAEDAKRNYWISCACHSAEELEIAFEKSLDFALLSPVAPTTSHPGAKTLGIKTFQEWATAAKLPVYGLGGLGLADVSSIRRAGGQGVASISSFWR